MLQHGLGSHAPVVAPPEVVTVMLFPPVPKPSPATAATPLKPAPPPRKVAGPAVVRRLPAPPARSAPVAPPSASVAPAPAPTPAVTAAPAPAAAPVVVAPAPQPPTIATGVQYLQAPQPDYPAQSKRLGEEGRVVLRVLVDLQGRAERIDIQKSSGFARLDEAAREAVRQAVFKPQLEDGRPVVVVAIVPINFKLD
ncbi:MAG: TonB family protein [Herminiimonas sp.]|nr:TonB family protein [Herminiimonas sp.]